MDLNKKATGSAGTAASSTTPGMPCDHVTVLDSDGDPHEYAVSVPQMYQDGTDPVILIGISKAGGGTPGKAYSGSWYWSVTSDGETVLSGSDMGSGPMATHAKIARVLADFLYAAGESLYLRKSDSQYADEYDEPQTAFLVSEYERLGSFAEEGN